MDLFHSDNATLSVFCCFYHLDCECREGEPALPQQLILQPAARPARQLAAAWSPRGVGTRFSLNTTLYSIYVIQSRKLYEGTFTVKAALLQNKTNTWSNMAYNG